MDISRIDVNIPCRLGVSSKSALMSAVISLPVNDANFFLGSHSATSLRLYSNRSVRAQNFRHDGQIRLSCSSSLDSCGRRSLLSVVCYRTKLKHFVNTIGFSHFALPIVRKSRLMSVAAASDMLSAFMIGAMALLPADSQ